MSLPESAERLTWMSRVASEEARDGAARDAQESQWWGYAGAATMLLLAFLFPVGLMIFDPTLMFERGWEQYVGTAIYFWAVLTLSRELLRLWKNERAFAEAPRLLKRLTDGVRPAARSARRARQQRMRSRVGRRRSPGILLGPNPPVDGLPQGELAARR